MKTIIKKIFLPFTLILIVSATSFSQEMQDMRFQLYDAIVSQDMIKIKEIFDDKNKSKKIKINNKVNIGDGMIITYLNSAVYTGKIDIVEYILSKKPDINLSSGGQNDKTPLIAAAENGYVDIIKLLISKKAQIDKKLNTGTTALMAAASRGQLDAVKILLQNKAGSGIKNINGETLLMMAVLGGNNDIVKIFLDKKYKIDINAKSKNKETALFMAYERQNSSIMNILKEAGAKDDRVVLKIEEPKNDESKKEGTKSNKKKRPK